MAGIQFKGHRPPTDPAEQALEWARCSASPLYFVASYVQIFNATEERWLPFDLWPAQQWSLLQLHRQRLIIALKARQLGFTWLCLGFSLWLLLFRSSHMVGFFSRTEPDAQDLLDFRLKGMYDRLPAFLRAASVTVDNKTRWELSNGSICMAFPTTGGRSYTFGYVLVDEADFQPDLDKLMRAVKPTVDAGGRMTLLSTVDKDKPVSRFKQIYRQAKKGGNEWTPIFLPWHARPDRTAAWYASAKQDAEANTGALDDLHQEYPATDAEALASKTLNKRIPGAWLQRNFVELDPLALDESMPAIEQLEVYALPSWAEHYVIGADPAEGNPTSDDSALTVLNRRTGEEVAALSGKYQPGVFASLIDQVARWYNGAHVLVERNNHGHAVILWLLNNAADVTTLAGLDERHGWLSSPLGKVILYDQMVEAVQYDGAKVHSFETFAQLSSIEGSSLRAPEGLMDDRADSFALANVARALSQAMDRAGSGLVVHDEDVNISPY